MSMEDVEGTWIEITRKEYDELRLAYILVRDGKIVEINPALSKHRLRPGEPTAYTVHSEEHMLPCNEKETPNLTHLART